MTVATFSTDSAGNGEGYYYKDLGAGLGTWSALHDAVTANDASASTSEVTLIAYSNSKFRWLYRGRLYFDTSSIPDDAVIISVRIVGVYNGALDANWIGSPSASLVTWTPILPITNKDNYSQFGSVAKSNAPTLLVGNWNDEPFIMVLNDLTLINKTGITYLGIRSSYDRDDSPPGTPTTTSQMQWIFAAGPLHSTYLEVTYTLAATVTTQAVTNIAGSSATGNGTITDTGGENCDKRGICWNTTGSPTVADSKIEESGSFDTGAFTGAITGLLPATLYYVKAYAHNSAGYAYGNEVSFTTLGVIFPSVATTRATGLIHRYDARRGIYQLETSLGGVTSIYAIPGDPIAKRATADKQQEQDAAPIVTKAVTEASEIAKLLLKGATGFPTQPQQSISDKITALFPPIKKRPPVTLPPVDKSKG